MLPLVSLLLWANAARAQPSAAELDGMFELQTLLQVRYTQTLAAPSDDARPGFAVRDDAFVHHHDSFRLRRAYLRVFAEPAPWLQAKGVLDFAKLDHGHPEDVIRQAYVQLTPIPKHLELAAGYFKLPYSIMKLTSASKLPVADKGSTAELVTDLGFAGRDLGARVRVMPLTKHKRLRLSLGAYRGHLQDAHAVPLGAAAARAELRPSKGVLLGASVVHHAAEVERWSRGTAWGADASYRHKKQWLVRAEGLWGDRVDSDERDGAGTYFGAFALFELRVPLGPLTLQPCVRAEWLDADLEHDVGTRRVYTLALQLMFDRHVRVLLDATHTDVEDDSPSTPYVEHDHTRATAQLQVEI